MVARNNANWYSYSKLPAFNKKKIGPMFKNKETAFYLFLVMVICRACHRGGSGCSLHPI